MAEHRNLTGSHAQNVLIVDDEDEIRNLLTDYLGQSGYRVQAARSGTELLHALERGFHGVVLLDVQLPDANGLELLEQMSRDTPDNKVIIVTAHGSIGMALTAMREQGAFYVHNKLEEGFLTRLSVSVKNAFNEIHLGTQIRHLEDLLEQGALRHDIITVSPKMQHLLELIQHVTDSRVPVLIFGESGTGKELVARAIHFGGPRRERPFVAINCAGIPETLLESELFGYEKGAFTGAYARKIGRFEQAHTGTLFLDEIGELSTALQAKLLRVLQEQEFQRVGGTESIRVDVRVLSATNRNLQEEVRRDRFREDLYYRLAVFPLQIPPLRERPEDIPLLAKHFLGKFAASEGKPIRDISREAMRMVMEHPYPGNVRQLENAIAHAVVVCQTNVIEPADLPGFLHHVEQEGLSGEGSLGLWSFMDRLIRKPSDVPRLQAVEEALLRRALLVHGGNASATARALGVARSTLLRRLREMES
ncbi:MAG: sigma-54-dependent Fis family transcriptional regulator [Deltaproteobacteria bacterium]|nr:sigma-54-dependent Fis family transcriptional regulator [Deltaproteobacteria bacterium]